VALALIAAIYLGFALMDGRISIAILEGMVGTAFVVIALLGLWLAPVLIAAGLILRGCWDLAHRPHASRRSSLPGTPRSARRTTSSSPAPFCCWPTGWRRVDECG